MDQARGLVQFCAALASSAQNYSTLAQSSKPTLSQGLVRSLLHSIGSNETKTESSSAVVVMTAGRGRGKSAALGLGLAAAIEAGFPNIYVTGPSPENLTTLMQFVIRGIAAFGYDEHQDYVVSRSTDPEHNHSVIGIDIHRQSHRQSLIYLPPWELANHLSRGSQQADLVCVDEAAAIPLALVRHFVRGPRLIFMASTINGYEGTGRSLSLKLMKQLRNECRLAEATIRLNPKCALSKVDQKPPVPEKEKLGKGFRSADTSRVLYEITLEDAIRYANGDPVEAWLTELLCLDCGSSLVHDNADHIGAYYPPVDQCQLYYVNRDTLFAYHKSTEVFLHRLMGLYVASHYKNSPNDLQLLSDAPAHHIFCLLAPYNPESGRVPEILCVLQVCLEGKINKDRILRSLSRGVRPSGDLIPWTVSQQFCDAQFGELSGARVVRIATHPDYQNLGYGTRALQLLHDYYSGKVPIQSSETVRAVATLESNKSQQELKVITSNDDTDIEEEEEVISEEDGASGTNIVSEGDTTDTANNSTQSKLLIEKIERRGPSSLPPLLRRLCERPPEQLHYVGVSFGATPDLLRFWKRAGYVPVYLRQTLNELTGEFTCIMLKQFEDQIEPKMANSWLLNYYRDFRRRFMCLLPGCFRYMDAAYALELFYNKSVQHCVTDELSPEEIHSLFSVVDIERLRRYTQSLIDFHVISDLLPNLARLFFESRLPEVRLNKTQQVILLGLGLQHKTVERLASEFSRLLSDSGGTVKAASDRQSADPDAVLSRTEEMNIQSAVSGNLDNMASGLRPKGSDNASGTTWVKRIRGLLFVVVRELYRSLERTVGPTKGETHNTTLLPAKGQSVSAGKSLSLRLDAIEGDEDSDVPMAEPDDDGAGDVSHESLIGEGAVNPSVDDEDPLQEGLNEMEMKRRAEVVRQLLSEELSAGGGPLGSLNSYRVHGSDSDWAKAIVGHGSDLSSLRVQVPNTTEDNIHSKKKSKKRTRGEDFSDSSFAGKGKKRIKVKKAKHGKS